MYNETLYNKLSYNVNFFSPQISFTTQINQFMKKPGYYYGPDAVLYNQIWLYC